MYNKKYQNLNERTIKSVRSIIKEGLFKSDFKERLELLNELNEALAEIYKIEKPQIRIDNNIPECYMWDLDLIILNNRLSLITYLHEFKHQLQHKFNKRNTEDIARGWSISLFYKATPKLYNQSVKKGLIIHEQN